MRTFMITLAATAALTFAASAVAALPGGPIGSGIKADDSRVVQIHTGRFACHLTRKGWKRDTRPVSKSCTKVHRYRCWGKRNCWYRL